MVLFSGCGRPSNQKSSLPRIIYILTEKQIFTEAYGKVCPRSDRREKLDWQCCAFTGFLIQGFRWNLRLLMDVKLEARGNISIKAFMSTSLHKFMNISTRNVNES